jgi:glycosyltransferase involved in cell wall biosynthesis
MSDSAKQSHTPITISLCMIVKNEEATIERCLRSVEQIIDEIIIVDTGSTDKTKELVSQFTNNIYDFEWIDDFSAARNYAFSKATQEFILWLDADDVLFDQDRQKLLELKATLSREVEVITMLYYLSFDPSGNVACQIRRERLVKREKNYQWIGAVHEFLDAKGTQLDTGIAVAHKPLKHDSDRNLKIYERRQLKGEEFSPRDLYYYANELREHNLYNRAIECYQKFLETKQGAFEEKIAACASLADCYYLLHDEENELKYIYQSFQYSNPRSDFCCRLGFNHLNNNRIKQAIFWYTLATHLKTANSSWGLVNNQCATWLPHLQLCVCYSRLGDYKLAYEHNEKAAKFIPDNPMIHHNRKLLQSKLNIDSSESD